MSYYELLLFLHVAGATVWLGSGFLLQALFVRARRTDDTVLIERITAHTEWLAKRIFIPTSLLVVLLGVLLTIEGPWAFDQLWIALGLAGFAATFLLGVGLIEPEGKRLHAAMGKHGPTHPVTVRHTARIDAYSKLDLVLLFVVVFDMALKPTADDAGTLAIGAAALLAAGAYVVRQVRRPAAEVLRAGAT
ncbi:MAG: DUF2269 family protein [Gaiellaceae bacterium]